MKKIEETIKYSLDGVVAFTESDHTYKIGDKVLTSGTGFIKPFTKPFDAKAIAKKLSGMFKSKNYAKFKAGIALTDLEKKRATQKYWLNDWKGAAEHGTRTHAIMENYVLELDNKPNTLNEVAPYQLRDFKKATHGMDWLDKELDTLEEPELYAEYIAYSEELGIAGQIDLKVIDAKGVTHLYDWKTNKSIDKKSKYGDMCKEPIQEYSDCNFFKYTIQLSLYAYMEELKGAMIGKLCIPHLRENKVVYLEVEYRKDIIEKLLKYNDEKQDDK